MLKLQSPATTRPLRCETLEPRQMLAADAYEPGLDPAVGAIVTSYDAEDYRDSMNPRDQLTGWKSAVDELAALGADEVTFSVYRLVDGGNFRNGPTIDTVTRAVDYAVQKNLKVTLLPLFEATSGGGWRGNYNPQGAEQDRFREQYAEFVIELASIPEVSRLDIASEMDAMVTAITGPEHSNYLYFTSLIEDVVEAGHEGQIGFVATAESYRDHGYEELWKLPDVDYLGVSAYFQIFEGYEYWGVGELDHEELAWIAGVDPLPEETVQEMVSRWNTILDELTDYAAELEGATGKDLPVFIQEFGAVQKNYAAAFPAMVSPADLVAAGAGVDVSELTDATADDPYEQAALYDSLLQALEGRGDTIDAVTFWTWEHQASSSYRSVPNQDLYRETFAIWPHDGGGGEVVAEFLRTKERVFDGDFNGDGLTDVLRYGGNTGDIVVELSDGDGFTYETRWSNLMTRIDWGSVVVGDFTGDGMDDIAARANSDGTWWVGASTGSRFQFSYFKSRWDRNGYWSHVQVGDFDGNGFDDIMGRNEINGRIQIASSYGTGFTSWTWSHWLQTNPGTTADDPWATRLVWNDLVVGDFNGDGKDDIAGRALRDGTWWIGISTNDLQFVATSWGRWSRTSDWVHINVGDFDGNGRTDLIGLDLGSGTWKVASSLNERLYSWNWGTWSTNVDWSVAMIGDFNHDGRDDLMSQTLQTRELWAGISLGYRFSGQYWGKTYGDFVYSFAGDLDEEEGTDLIFGTLNRVWVAELSTGTGFHTVAW